MILLDGLLLDAELRSSEDLHAVVTRSPVERGPGVVDHVELEALSLDLSAVVSATPIGVAALGRATDTVSDAETRLRELRAQRTPFTVQRLRGNTITAEYPDMVFGSLSFPRSPSTGESLQIEARLVQIRLVDASRSSPPVATPTASRRRKRGARSATPVEPPIDREFRVDLDADDRAAQREFSEFRFDRDQSGSAGFAGSTTRSIPPRAEPPPTNLPGPRTAAGRWLL